MVGLVFRPSSSMLLLFELKERLMSQDMTWSEQPVVGIIGSIWRRQ